MKSCPRRWDALISRFATPLTVAVLLSVAAACGCSTARHAKPSEAPSPPGMAAEIGEPAGVSDFELEASPKRDALPEAPVLAASVSKHLFGGIPARLQGDNPEVLVNTGYAVGYSESAKDPLWAAYHLDLKKGTHQGTRPKVKFATDDRTTAKVKDGDYKPRSGEFDRGHMAPDHAILKFYGVDAALETFTMSNVCPQNACLNEETWEAWEKEVADVYTAEVQEVWVITGPIFRDHPDHVDPVGVAVPDAFFSIVVHLDAGQPRILCVKMAQGVQGKHLLSEFVVGLDEVENATGFNFFPNLTPAQKAQATVTDAHWQTGANLIPTFHCRLAH